MDVLEAATTQFFIAVAQLLSLSQGRVNGAFDALVAVHSCSDPGPRRESVLLLKENPRPQLNSGDTTVGSGIVIGGAALGSSLVGEAVVAV